jgi:putative phosphonate metabolism protein
VISPRYALYAVPPAPHPLWSVTAEWLGRDPETGADLTAQLPDWLAPTRWREITAEPRRYGFHGTLKPPFALTAGNSTADLAAGLQRFADETPRLGGVRLTVASLSGFLALVPCEPAPSLLALADRCVRHFDAFRAPPREAELARRRRAGLSPAQEAHLRRWGYPYVFDQFRYHMTLSGRLDTAERERVGNWLTDRLEASIAAPVPLDLALFEQPSRDLPFRLVRRYPAGG